jgi:hypothetical protein
MTKEQFAQALRELKLPHSAALTARLLGISRRQIFYGLSGRCPVSEPVAMVCRLLLMLDQTGQPPAAVDAALANDRVPATMEEP